jgi:hypothetical protein
MAGLVLSGLEALLTLVLLVGVRRDPGALWCGESVIGMVVVESIYRKDIDSRTG